MGNQTTTKEKTQIDSLCRGGGVTIELFMKQNQILRIALIQIVNDPESAVAIALRAIKECRDLEYQLRIGGMQKKK